MSQAKSVTQGFLATATAIWMFTCGWLVQLNVWVALGLFLGLLVPFSIRGITYLRSLSGKQPAQTRVKQVKDVLMSLQETGFACWFADVISTIFVVDISQSDSELNPLGWPLGAIGALAYFVPITFVVYYLLYKNKAAASFYGAVAITFVSFFMGARSVNASFYNLSNLGSVNWQTSQSAGFLIFGVWAIVYAVLLILNIVLLRKSNQVSKKGNPPFPLEN